MALRQLDRRFDLCTYKNNQKPIYVHTKITKSLFMYTQKYPKAYLCTHKNIQKPIYVHTKITQNRPHFRHNNRTHTPQTALMGDIQGCNGL